MEKCEKLKEVEAENGDAISINTGLEFQEPPPAYRRAPASLAPSDSSSQRSLAYKTTNVVQVTKILALAAVVIAGMLSIALVVSAWISSTSCHHQLAQLQQQSAKTQSFDSLLQPEHLKGFLALNQLGTGEDETSTSTSTTTTTTTPTPTPAIEVSEPEEDDEEESEEEKTPEANNNLLRLPLEFSFAEDMLGNAERSRLACFIQKKEINNSGSQMAISCNNGNIESQSQSPRISILEQVLGLRPRPQQSQPQAQGSGLPLPLRALLNSALAAVESSVHPVHLIGPIPLPGQGQGHPHQRPAVHVQGPIVQFMEQLSQRPPAFYQEEPEEPIPQQSSHSLASALGLPPHLLPIIFPQGIPSGNSEEAINNERRAQLFQETRALPHPIPIMPRAHAVIRPRRSVPESNKRVKRCACDCSCKNHQD